MDENKIKLLAVVGPTGSGKTALSIEFAKALDGEIISCDSMQIYKHMDIGTAKPTTAEKQGIPHYMLDILEPSDNFSVSEFVVRAKEHINDITSRGKLPILVGGTGLYVDSLIGDVNFAPMESDEKYRASLHELAEEKGNLYLHDMLSGQDKAAADKIHPNNVRRVVRALEILHLTGKTKTEQDKIAKQTNSPYKSVLFGLDMPREELYDRINKRVDIMLANGLVDEVKSLVEMGVSPSVTAMQAIGYKEIIEYITGDCTLEFAVEKIKQESRRYAKRQITWFWNNDKINRIMLQECNEKFTAISQFAKNALHN